MKKTNIKRNTRSKHYNNTPEINPSHLMNEIMKVDDGEIFLSEYQVLEESLIAVKETKIIKTNFLLNKLEEIDSHISMARIIKEKLPYDNDSANQMESDLDKMIDMQNLERTKDLILKRLKIVISEDLAKLDKIKFRSIFPDNSFQNSQNTHNVINSHTASTPINKENKNTNLTMEIEMHNYFENYDNRNNNIGNNINLKLKIFYYDGSELYPQIINMNIQDNSNYDYFIREFKKTVGIYEFAAFKIVLMEERNDLKFVKNIYDFNLNALNEIKVVPIDYEIE